MMVQFAGIRVVFSLASFVQESSKLREVRPCTTWRVLYIGILLGITISGFGTFYRFHLFFVVL